MQTNQIRIDAKRLWHSLMEMGHIGATADGGVFRPGLGEADKQGRDLVVQWGHQAGLTVTVDQIGNIFMRREGQQADGSPVTAGSCIDTLATGGKFAGVYGVLAALEVMRSLNDAGIQTVAPLEVALWSNKEGGEFACGMMGSSVFCKPELLQKMHNLCNEAGNTVAVQLETIGYLGEQVVGQHPMAAYFEVHIEQGPVLDNNESVIGVCPAAIGLVSYDCTVVGNETHAGPTPVALRKDALQISTKIMQEVVALARRYRPHGRGTVGMVQVSPNNRNVIPGRVTFSIDLRNVDEEALAKMQRELQAYIDDISLVCGVPITLEQVDYYAPSRFDETCSADIRRAAEAMGYAHMEMISGAGHDAAYLARVVPTGMILVPCSGESPSQNEYASPEHLAAGCNVLLQAMLERAQVVA